MLMILPSLLVVSCCIQIFCGLDTPTTSPPSAMWAVDGSIFAPHRSCRVPNDHQPPSKSFFWKHRWRAQRHGATQVRLGRRQTFWAAWRRGPFGNFGIKIASKSAETYHLHRDVVYSEQVGSQKPMIYVYTYWYTYGHMVLYSFIHDLQPSPSQSFLMKSSI